MKTITVNLYSISELSERAREKAIEKLSDINVDFDWWDSTYEDAKNIGLKITGFGLEREKHADGEFNLSPCEVAKNILNNHGEECDTYKTALEFMEEWQPVLNNYMDENHPDYESRQVEETLLSLETDFLNGLLNDYSTMLQNECDYLCSKEAIIETIEANEYLFTEDGKMY